MARLATCVLTETLPALPKNGLTNGRGCGLYRKSDFPASTIPEGAANDRYAFAPLYHWSLGITVSTLHSESSDRVSSPREAYAFAGHCNLCIGVFLFSWRAFYVGKKLSRGGYLVGVLVAGRK